MCCFSALQIARLLACEAVFKSKAGPQSQRRWRELKDPKEQYRHYGVMRLPLAPKLSSVQIEIVLSQLTGTPFRQVFWQRDSLSRRQIARLPESRRSGAEETRLELVETVGEDILELLHDYVAELEVIVGFPAESILIRDERGERVSPGHIHRWGHSNATASVTLEGPGTYVHVGDGVYQTPPGETIVFNDGGISPTFHGTPTIKGRRFFIAVAFLDARFHRFNKSGFIPGAAQPFPNAR